jgi:ABC-type antimicrobial peptide transport system permease subunit
LFRQFVTEGLVLAVVGSTLGLVVAFWTMQVMTKLIPADMLAEMPYLNGIGIFLWLSARPKLSDLCSIHWPRRFIGSTPVLRFMRRRP